MRLFFTLATALMAGAGTIGCQAHICTSCTTAVAPQVVATPTSCDSAAGCDSAADCDSAPASSGTSSTAGCDSPACSDGSCSDGTCQTGQASGRIAVPVITPVRNLAARLRANAETTTCGDGNCGTGCADGSCDSGCADGSCGSGFGNGSGGQWSGNGSLFGGILRRPGFGGAGMGQGGMGYGAGGMGHGGMGHGGMGQGGCGIPGCGLMGRLCGRCGAGNQHPYGGVSPHTPPMAGPFGGMSPAYGYPYYTTRGPRDFFMDNPPSLGR